MKADVLTLDNKKAGSIELAEEIFGVLVRRDILHRVEEHALSIDVTHGFNAMISSV